MSGPKKKMAAHTDGQLGDWAQFAVDRLNDPVSWQIKKEIKGGRVGRERERCILISGLLKRIALSSSACW